MVTASTTGSQSCHVLPGDIKLGQLLYTFLKNAVLDFFVIGRTVCIFAEYVLSSGFFLGVGVTLQQIDLIEQDNSFDILTHTSMQRQVFG